MCGIFGIVCPDCAKFDAKNFLQSGESFREVTYRLSGKQRHRGPDFTGVHVDAEHRVALAFERLGIRGIKTGNQPFLSTDGSVALIAVGEIYNYRALAERIAERRGVGYTPRSDCDVILAAYEEFGVDLLAHISGMFTFLLYDKRRKFVFAARDPVGIVAMYYGKDVDGNVWVANEMKCLAEKCVQVDFFPPGQLLHGQLGEELQFKRYFEPVWETVVPKREVDLKVLREKLEAAVWSHLDCEVPFGTLLSGGVDSSLVASIATKLLRKKNPDFRLKSYSVGLKGAPDFKYSRMVADFIDSDHEEIYFTVEQGLDCISDIIYQLETYDVTTIRSSIPMFILCRSIKAEGYKMILSGEGADELFGGYLYFHSAPNAEDFHFETVARVKNLHLSDCLRANKSSMAWGLELRVPFLDSDFVEHVMTIRPEDRMPLKGTKQSIEKYVLRAAFADGYLPEEVLWRQKEQFSDGVGYDWIDTIKDYAASHVSDEEFARAAEMYPYNTPRTKEALYYRKKFEQTFPGESYARTVMQWVPRLDWGCSYDPSGRAQSAHSSRG